MFENNKYKFWNFVCIITFIFCFNLSLAGRTSEIREYNGKEISSISDLQETSLKGPPEIDMKKYRLKITGNVDTNLTLTYDEIIDSYPRFKKVSRLKCVEDWSAEILWEGLRLIDLLKTSGIKPESRRVIFHCADDYTTSLSLDYLEENKIILADRANGVKLPDSLGFPFQLIAEGKWGYKWAKWIEEIEVISDTAYRGFWESKSLSKEADTSELYLREKYRKYYEEK